MPKQRICIVGGEALVFWDQLQDRMGKGGDEHQLQFLATSSNPIM